MLDLLLHPVLDNGWISFDVPSLIQNFWSATFDGLTFGAIYGLVAVGYTLVYGVLNLINFAHSEVFIMGCYGVVLVLTTLGFGPNAPTLPLVADRARPLTRATGRDARRRRPPPTSSSGSPIGHCASETRRGWPF